MPTKPAFSAVLAAHRKVFDRVVEKGGVDEVRKLYEAGVAELAGRMAAAHGKAPYSAHIHKQALVQLQVGIAALTGRMAAATGQASSAATTAGFRSMISSINAMEKHYSEAETPIPVEESARFAGILDAQRTSLLRAHATSMARYGTTIVGEVEKELSIALLTQKPTHEVILDVQRKTNNLWWQGERIVRTETAWAFNASSATGIQAAQEELPDLLMRWAEHVDDLTGRPLDDRVAADSLALHGQVALPGKPFVMPSDPRVSAKLWGKTFDFPPNRPNDRASLDPWRPGWGIPAWVWDGTQKVDAEKYLRANPIAPKPKDVPPPPPPELPPEPPTPPAVIPPAPPAPPPPPPPPPAAAPSAVAAPAAKAGFFSGSIADPIEWASTTHAQRESVYIDLARRFTDDLRTRYQGDETRTRLLAERDAATRAYTDAVEAWKVHVRTAFLPGSSIEEGRAKLRSLSDEKDTARERADAAVRSLVDHAHKVFQEHFESVAAEAGGLTGKATWAGRIAGQKKLVDAAAEAFGRVWTAEGARVFGADKWATREQISTVYDPTARGGIGGYVSGPPKDVPRPVEVRATKKRAQYTEHDGIARVPSDQPWTIRHELGHWAEHSNANLHRVVKDFLVERTSGEALQQLRVLTGNKGYKKWEVARRDRFFDAYVGKHYLDAAGKIRDGSTEVFTMGVEQVDAMRWETFAGADPGHAGLVLAILLGRFRF